MIGQVRKPKIGTRSNLKNPSTVLPSSHRDKHFYLFNFLSNVNRAAYKCPTNFYPRSAPRPRKHNKGLALNLPLLYGYLFVEFVSRLSQDRPHLMKDRTIPRSSSCPAGAPARLPARAVAEANRQGQSAPACVPPPIGPQSSPSGSCSAQSLEERGRKIK